MTAPRAGLALLGALLWATALADQGSPALDRHFEALRAATNEARIIELERSIASEWKRSGDAGIDAALGRAAELVEQWAFDEALVVLDDIVERRPGFAEGWNQRASLYYLMNDFEASVRDIDETLALEPRHFGALAGLGEIRLKLGDPDGALDAFERALRVHPHLPVVKFKVAKLREMKAQGLF